MKGNVKILLYGHDGRGLGHVIRTCAIGEGIKIIWPQADVLIVSGENKLTSIANRNIECVKLPSYFTIDMGGCFKTISPTLNIGIDTLTSIRKNILKSLFEEYRPDIVLIDFSPKGKRGELEEEIVNLKKNHPSSLIVLGLRGILDDPIFVKNDNLSPENICFIKKYFDLILIYGEQKFFDFQKEYNIDWGRKVKICFTGLVVRPTIMMGEETQKEHLRGKRLLISFGNAYGAEDIAKKILTLILNNKEFNQIKITVLCGSKLDKNKLKSFIRNYDKYNNNFRIIQFENNVTKWYHWATHFLGYSGYNTVCEVLYFKLPALFISRDQTEREQFILANILSKRSNIIHLHENPLEIRTFNKSLYNLFKIHSLKGIESLNLYGATKAAQIIKYSWNKTN